MIDSPTRFTRRDALKSLQYEFKNGDKERWVVDTPAIKIDDQFGKRLRIRGRISDNPIKVGWRKAPA